MEQGAQELTAEAGVSERHVEAVRERCREAVRERCREAHAAASRRNARAAASCNARNNRAEASQGEGLDGTKRDAIPEPPSSGDPLEGAS